MSNTTTLRTVIGSTFAKIAASGSASKTVQVGLQSARGIYSAAEKAGQITGRQLDALEKLAVKLGRETEVDVTALVRTLRGECDWSPATIYASLAEFWRRTWVSDEEVVRPGKGHALGCYIQWTLDFARRTQSWDKAMTLAVDVFRAFICDGVYGTKQMDSEIVQSVAQALSEAKSVEDLEQIFLTELVYAHGLGLSTPCFLHGQSVVSEVERIVTSEALDELPVRELSHAYLTVAAMAERKIVNSNVRSIMAWLDGNRFGTRHEDLMAIVLQNMDASTSEIWSDAQTWGVYFAAQARAEAQAKAK